MNFIIKDTLPRHWFKEHGVNFPGVYVSSELICSEADMFGRPFLKWKLDSNAANDWDLINSQQKKYRSFPCGNEYLFELSRLSTAEDSLAIIYFTRIEKYFDEDHSILAGTLMHNRKRLSSFRDVERTGGRSFLVYAFVYDSTGKLLTVFKDELQE